MAYDLPTEMYSFYQTNVVGGSGSGKFTTEKLIAKKLGYLYIKLDEIQWKPNWTDSTEERLFANLERSL